MCARDSRAYSGLDNDIMGFLDAQVNDVADSSQRTTADAPFKG